MAHNAPDHQESQASVLFMLGQLTAKVDALLVNQTWNNERHDVLEGRVSGLEKDKAKILGAAIVASSLAALSLEYFVG
jgi:hypothetical protein